MPSHSHTWKAKGKARAIFPRDEGPGGREGKVLEMGVTGSGVYDIAYTIPVHIGGDDDNDQVLNVQVDTGSSDLWVTSTACGSDLCKQSKRYNPDAATDTGVSFSINYLQGNVSGPIVWDRVAVGGYSIENQAFAAADTIVNEPMSSDFNGILGLALPLNSIIADSIPPVITNSPDGAAWASNLFSITPVAFAPSARFLSLSLSRPGSTQIPALLGIGRHPAALVPDASKIKYSTVIADRLGTLFWKSQVRGITVYVDGERREVEVGRSNTGAPWPSAVLDSGVPLILTTSRIANGIYGAIGIAPAQDGQYYVPCDQPLNMTVTLDDREEIPIHPLDLTGEPPRDNQAQFCIGLIQPADAALLSPNNAIGDMILGVPFMRNVYTVMAYTEPSDDGSFTNGTDVDPDAVDLPLRPRLGLLSLTDPTKALEEFKTVRVLNQPLDTNSNGTSGGSTAGSAGDAGKKISVGIIVLIALMGFFALCFSLFFLRWFLTKRKYRGHGAGAAVGGAESEYGDKKAGGAAYMLARRYSRGSLDGREDGLPTEDELRRARYEEYMRKERIASQYSASTGRTQVVDLSPAPDGELGFKSKQKDADGTRGLVSGDLDDVWDPSTALNWGDNTLVGGAAVKKAAAHHDAPIMVHAIHHDDKDHTNPTYFEHQRQYSSPEHNHGRGLSISVPLLPHPPDDSPPETDDLAEFGGISMAGIGTAARGSMHIDSALRHSMASPNHPEVTSMPRDRPVRSPTGPRISSHSQSSHPVTS